MNNVRPFPAKRQELRLTRPVVLVGLMGAGKTTSGRRLAKKLHVPFLDADDEIEDAAGMRIADIFEIYGEEEFRDGERKVMARLLSEEPCVLATGGGAFMNPETRQLVKEKSTSVWLKADLETHVRRTSLRNTRPILKRGDPAKILADLIAQREPIYAEADIMVESHDGPNHDTAKDIFRALQKFHDEGGVV